GICTRGGTAMSMSPKPVVLIVDDETSILRVLELALRQEGFETSAAANGSEAIAELSRRPDIPLVLLDVHLPGMDGPTILRALRQINPQLACCFASGDLECYSTPELEAMGVSRLFPKPFPISELTQQLRQLASRSPAAPV